MRVAERSSKKPVTRTPCSALALRRAARPRPRSLAPAMTAVLRNRNASAASRLAGARAPAVERLAGQAAGKGEREHQQREDQAGAVEATAEEGDCAGERGDRD